MPRPNPPRKRPRRPAGNRVRADAQLNKQTAQSAQGGQPAPAKPATSRQAKAQPVAAPPPDELWSRRSYAVLIGMVAILEVVITAIQWAFAPSVSSGVPKAPLWEYLVFLNPISLLIAAILAPFAARYVTKERRALRPVESLVVGLVAYFVSTFVTFGVGALLGASSAAATGSGAGVTPCPSTATCAASPNASATATATARPSPSPSASAHASPSGSALPTPTATANVAHGVAGSAGTLADIATATLRADETAGFVAGDVITFVITLFIYPPLYKRLRIRRPPPGAAKPRGDRSKPAPREKPPAKQAQTQTEEQQPNQRKRRWPWP